MNGMNSLYIVYDMYNSIINLGLKTRMHLIEIIAHRIVWEEGLDL